MAYNTGNPLGSTDPRDLVDNSAIVDQYANGDQPSTTDRLGNERMTWAGLEARVAAALEAAGYVYVGEYAGGITLSNYNEVVRDSGEFWRASASATLPYTTTGAGLPEGGALVSVGDAVLRQDLANSTDPAKGPAMIPYNDSLPYSEGTVGSALNKLQRANAKRLASALTRAVGGSPVTIKCYGDSLTYGMDTSGPNAGINGSAIPRATYQYPETLQSALSQSLMFPGGVTVTNCGYPGDTVLNGLTRWGEEGASDIAIIMYATNDAVESGGEPTVNSAEYVAGMRDFIDREAAKGAAIILLLPPPVEAINEVARKRQRNINAYRTLIREIGAYYGAPVFDVSQLIQHLSRPYSDETHLNGQGYNEWGWQLSSALVLNQSAPREVSAGTLLEPSDLIGMGISTRIINSTGARYGRLLEIPAGGRLNITVDARQDVIPVIHLLNTTNTVRSLTAFYSGGAARSGVQDIVLTDNSNVPPRKGYGIQPLHVGLRTVTISNLGANPAYIEYVRFEAKTRRLAPTATAAGYVSTISGQCTSRPKGTATWDTLVASGEYLSGDWEIAGRMYFAGNAPFCGIGVQSKIDEARSFPNDAVVVGRVANGLVVKELVGGAVTNTTYSAVFTAGVFEYDVLIKAEGGALSVYLDGVLIVDSQVVSSTDGYINMLSESNDVFKTETITVSMK